MDLHEVENTRKFAGMYEIAQNHGTYLLFQNIHLYIKLKTIHIVLNQMFIGSETRFFPKFQLLNISKIVHQQVINKMGIFGTIMAEVRIKI